MAKRNAETFFRDDTAGSGAIWCLNMYPHSPRAFSSLQLMSEGQVSVGHHIIQHGQLQVVVRQVVDLDNILPNRHVRQNNPYAHGVREEIQVWGSKYNLQPKR